MNGPALTYENVIARLQERLPDFHPADPDLPHVAFGDLVNFLGDRLDRKTPPDLEEDQVRTIIDFVEDAAGSGDEKVVDLVVVSFIENLHILGPNCRQVRAALKPRTQRLADQFEASGGGKVCP